MKAKLNPCPLCGSEEISNLGYAIRCSSCTLLLGALTDKACSLIGDMSKRDAITRIWNRELTEEKK